jgi:granule-bound starch synthase
MLHRFELIDLCLPLRLLQPCACASTGGLVDTIIEGKTGFHMGRLSVDVSLALP